MTKLSLFAKRLLVALILLTIPAGVALAETNKKPFVVPEVQTWVGAEGVMVPSGRVVVNGNAKVAGPVAEALCADYEALTGRSLTIVKGKAAAGDIVLSIKKDKQLGAEGYRMNVDGTATLTAATREGLIWATRTLLQISEQSADGSLPKGNITDKPQYRMRGFMIDCGRKFIPMSYLKDLVKIMAYYKMNTLQVHLNDNGFRQFFDNDWNKTQSAFRLECDTYPGLTAKDGFYTKKEFMEFQDMAAKAGVEIIPEIDVPAHSLAFTHYKPEIASKDYGMDHLDLFNPETYTFVDGLFKEYLGGKNPVFSGKRVHIGTDEYSNAKKEVVEKFRYFTDRYIRYVESFGKQALVWGALTHAQGDTPVKAEGVIMSCWNNNFANPTEMKKQGYKLISIPDGLVYIVPSAGYYYDYLNCDYLYKNWTPSVIANQTFDEGDPAVEGGMFAVWNDHVGNGISTKDIHHRTMPAMQTLAVKCWAGSHTTVPYEEFDRLRHNISEAPGVNQLGRLAAPVEVAELVPGATLPANEVGYDYTVTFTVRTPGEDKGTVLLSNDDAVVYLADPRDGRLGFARDGYLTTFNYRLPKNEAVTLTIEGTNRATTLYVNGQKKETLDELAMQVMKESDRTNFQYGVEGAWNPVTYAPTSKMRYQRTLVFPLHTVGNFKGKVTNLKAVNAIKK